jgi:S1-C subfamily serine protease
MRLVLILSLLLAPLLHAAEKPAIVRVNVTSQGWDFLRPWGKRQPATKRAIGAVIAPKGEPRVLVTGDLVQNSTYLEFEVPEGGRKVPASVEFVDYEANLAVLRAEDADFLKDVPRLEVGPSAIGQQLDVWQLENNGRLLVTSGLMTTADYSAYPLEGSLLIYRMTVRMQSRDSSFTLPVINKGKLTGVLMSYDSQSSNANVIPAPVIEHFLKDAADGKYEGFPRAGYGFSAMRDPALRRYSKVPEDVTGGVFITETLAGGSSESGGVRKGDVLIAVDNFQIDRDGNYDDPAYGKLAAGHLLSTLHFVGDTVAFHVLRDGKKEKVEVKLERKASSEYVSDPYIIDTPPRFYVLGGLILQELSRQYLREFSGPGERGRRPPDRLAYYDRYQNELFRNGPKKIVFLSRVLPTPATVGYEELNSLVVTKINGVTLQSLDDVPAALAKAANGIHTIDFNEDPTRIYLDAAQADQIERLVKNQYQLPSLKRIQETPPTPVEPKAGG